MTKKATTKKTKTDDTATDELTISDIARELKLDPKRARATLRAAGKKAVDGRWPTVKRDSKAHTDIVALLTTTDDTK